MDAKIEKLNINECDGEFESSSEELDDSALNGFDDEDDEKENYCEVKGLFSEQIFNNVTDMFKYEAEFNKFNLIDVINKHKLDMLSYIKMINYIRQEVKLNLILNQVCMKSHFKLIYFKRNLMLKYFITSILAKSRHLGTMINT